ncbi:hypothetical protein GF336_04715 [Candidatus Woesearchaeota archaeon]|nr:hypothetical protein [Candidatus Woesearchaeota archaeon]
MTLGKYYHIGKINLQNSLAYIIDFFISSGLVIMIMLILIALWRVLYQDRNIIAGFTLAQMIWYLVITESIVFMPLRGIIREIEGEIKSGKIAYQLNKPYNYIAAKFFSKIGFALLRWAIIFTAAVFIAWIFVGPIQLNIYGVFFGIISIFLSFVLSFLIACCIAIMAFWLEEVFGLYFMYDKMRFILGGFLFPLDILPLWLQIPARYLPFSAILYYPAKLFVDFSPEFMAKTFFFQLSWILVLIILVSILYRIGIKKVSINGG